MMEEIVSKAELVKAGAVEFDITYRQIGGDEGVSIQVYGEADSKRTEMLRIDCFQQEPHYHYGPENNDERVMLDYTAEGTPVNWALSRLRNRLIPMLVRAGYPETARSLDGRQVTEALDQVEAWTETLTRTKGD